MSTPGSNTLAMALTVLGSTPVNWFEFNGRTLNSGGVYVTTYKTPILEISGSVQAINRTKYEALGLDFEKKYIAWYVPNVAAVDLDRDVSGDVIETLGRRFQLVGSNDWLNIDGWRSLLAIDIGVATGALNGN